MARPVSATPRSTLHEREGALLAVEEVLRRSAEGHGAVLGLLGEAGLGKTTLLERACSDAREQGFRVALARGEAAESALPFGLLQQAASSLGDSARFADLAASSPAEPGARRFYATTKWLEQHAEEPLLLAIDDLHWADADSLALVGFLCRRVAGLPVACVVTSRPWPPEAAAMLGALHGDGRAHLESLKPLSDGASSRLMAEALGAAPEERIAHQAWSLSAGNPLLLEQVAHAIQEGTPIPEGSSARLRERFLVGRFTTAVPDSALRYAQMASVFGPNFRLSVVPRAAELTDQQADSALSALSTSGLLLGGRPGWGRFAHPMLCQAIYDDISPALRPRQHAKAFAALVAVDVPAAEAASHAVRAGLAGDASAVAVLTTAGREALRAGATASGRAHLTAAVELAGAAATPDLLLSVSQARMADGDLEGAAELGARVLEVPGVDRATSVQAHWSLGRAAMFAGHDTRGEEHFQAAADLASDADPDLAAQVLLDGAMMWWMAQGPRASIEVARQARGLAQSARAAGEAAAVWAQAALMSADPGGMRALESAGGLTAESTGQAVPDFLISGGPLLAFLFGCKIVERFDQAENAFAVSRSGAERVGSPLAIGLCLVTHADTLTRLGRLDEALALLDRAGQLADFSVLVGPWAAIGRAHVLLELGRSSESRTQCATVDGILAAVPGRFPLLRLWLWRIVADLQLAEGDVTGACALLERVEALAGESGIVEPCVVPWHALAVRANLAAGRIEEVSRLAAQLETSTSGLPCRSPRAVAAGARALVAEREGDRRAAREQFEVAVSQLQHTPMPLARSELLLSYGSFLRRGGERQEARAKLKCALEAAVSAGGGRWQAAAEQELRVAGGRRRPAATRLTAQEQRVAALATEGLSNKQLAARLGITPKTVSNHLEHIYQKLDIHSRRELMTAPVEPESPSSEVG